MEFNQNKKISTAFKNVSEERRIPKISLGLHVMPKTETGHFRQWLVLGLTAFVLIVVIILIFI